jgi:uncharacterized membrane protein YfhO
LTVVTPVEGYLFVSEMWMPDWVVYVDGKSQGEVLKANYTFRAVHVPAGSHEVHMVYRPRPWRIGLTVTLATLAALFIWAVWSLVDAASGVARLRSTPSGRPARSSRT